MIESGDRPRRTIYLLKRAETAVRAGLKACLHPLRITPRQYITLSLLRDEQDQSAADLARKAGITPQSMSETIAALIREGWIDRLESPEHGRILLTRLTARGQTLLAECERAVDIFEIKLLANLPEDKLEALRQTLRAIAKAG